MFKYSIYDKALSLTKLVDKADSMKINYLETGNFLFQDGDFISWDHLEDIRNLLIESQKIIINIHTEVPYYEVDFHLSDLGMIKLGPRIKEFRSSFIVKF
jgi:hypothetical protein